MRIRRWELGSLLRERKMPESLVVSRLCLFLLEKNQRQAARESFFVKAYLVHLEVCSCLVGYSCIVHSLVGLRNALVISKA